MFLYYLPTAEWKHMFNFNLESRVHSLLKMLVAVLSDHILLHTFILSFYLNFNIKHVKYG